MMTRRSVASGCLRGFLIFTGISIAVIAAVVVIIGFVYINSLPTLEELTPSPIAQTSKVYDIDGNLASCDVSTGTLIGGEVCFTPFTQPGTAVYDIVLTATDSCGLIDVCTTQVTVTVNQPPEVSCPGEITEYTCFIEAALCVEGFVATDPDDNKTVVHFEIWQGKALQNPKYWLAGR